MNDESPLAGGPSNNSSQRQRNTRPGGRRVMRPAKVFTRDGRVYLAEVEIVGNWLHANNVRERVGGREAGLVTDRVWPQHEVREVRSEVGDRRA
jgi:hypothetical protein